MKAGKLSRDGERCVVMGIVTASRIAMACKFEVVALGDDEAYLRAVLERALEEVEQLELQLSPFIADSHLSDINRHAYHRPVKVEPQLFWLLKRAVKIGIETDGAFDITVGALTLTRKRWGSHSDTSTKLYGTETEQDALVGLNWLQLDDDAMTVRFLKEGIAIDLCGIAKGYAVDVVASRLLEAGVDCFFVHGGKSSMRAFGKLPNENAWRIGVTNPAKPSERLAVVELCDGVAVGVSEWCINSVSGKMAHIVDPRAPNRIGNAEDAESSEVLRAYAICGSATDADALSTAFLLLGVDGVKSHCELYESRGAILLIRDGSGVEVLSFGLEGLAEIHRLKNRTSDTVGGDTSS
ncbi:MAG: hypothetical protein HZRFUVUK_001155 [Candidatus Fervidibacterota bacterium]